MRSVKYRKADAVPSQGYDPVLELASASKFDKDGNRHKGQILRKEQEYITKVINGESECRRTVLRSSTRRSDSFAQSRASISC